jgi:hypothetical protein
LSGRVHYEEGFEFTRASDGAVADPAWLKLVDLLRRARLAPDPFPVCSGAARVEAFGAGAPSPHLAVRFDRGAWGRRQEAVVEVSALEVPTLTASTLAEYEELCRRCLYDERFADSAAAAQADVFERVTDPRAYWGQIRSCYEEWHTQRIGLRLAQ